MDTITGQPRMRHRLGRLAAIATISAALLAFGLSDVANASTVHTSSTWHSTFCRPFCRY